MSSNQSAPFNLSPLCTDQNYPYGQSCPQQYLQKNVFSDLGCAVWSSCVTSLGDIKVDNNIFENNFRGIRLEGMEGAIITNNTFDVGANLPFPNLNLYHKHDSYGIHLEGCSGYKLQQNTFVSDDEGYYGAIITNSGAYANLLNNNNFSGLK